jgi:hypothetical protein
MKSCSSVGHIVRYVLVTRYDSYHSICFANHRASEISSNFGTKIGQIGDFFIITMIIFNTIKKAEHWVNWCRKTRDFHNNGYDWSSRETYIDGNLVKVRNAGDGCGCGCDTYLYDYTEVVGRIKAWDDKTIRDSKLAKLDLD